MKILPYLDKTRLYRNPKAGFKCSQMLLSMRTKKNQNTRSSKQEARRNMWDLNRGSRVLCFRAIFPGGREEKEKKEEMEWRI